MVFDEVDFYEQNGRVIPQGASYYFRRRGAYCGDCCCEVQVDKPGGGDILWNPVFLDSHETGYLHFAYRKTNPKSKVSVAWGPQLKPLFVAGEGPLRGAQGWQLPYFEDTAYHEVVVDYVDMQPPARGEKRLPRGPVGVLALGLREASPGDSVFFDKIEFLAARGVRPDAGHGLVVGGQLAPRLDGQVVTLTIDGKARTTVTCRGGWYIFTDVPAGAVAEISYEDRGVRYYPARGRLVQIGRNDLEYHIYATDPRARRCRAPGFVEQPVHPRAEAGQRRLRRVQGEIRRRLRAAQPAILRRLAHGKALLPGRGLRQQLRLHRPRPPRGKPRPRRPHSPPGRMLDRRPADHHRLAHEPGLGIAVAAAPRACPSRCWLRRLRVPRRPVGP